MIGIHSYRKFSVHTTFFKVFNYLIGNLFVEQIFKFYLKQKKTLVKNVYVQENALNVHFYQSFNVLFIIV